jgi:hypothetical protein
MKKNLLITSFVIVFAIITNAANRIQAFKVDRRESKAIYLSPGLGSVVIFPCPLIEVFVGRSEELKAQISPNDRKTLFLNLKKNVSVPTNLIVRCEELRTIFVFDIVPSLSRHQDVVEIRNFFGRPDLEESQKSPVTELKEVNRAVIIKKPEIIGRGK